MRKHGDKLAYFFIAFAIILLIRGLGGIGKLTVTTILLYVSIAVSLLASNMPRVLDIPLHYAYPVRCVEYFTFGTAVVCFIALCLHHMILAYFKECQPSLLHLFPHPWPGNALSQPPPRRKAQ